MGNLLVIATGCGLARNPGRKSDVLQNCTNDGETLPDSCQEWTAFMGLPNGDSIEVILRVDGVEAIEMK